MAAVWNLWCDYLKTQDITISPIPLIDAAHVIAAIGGSSHCYPLLHAIFTALMLEELLPDEIMCEFLIVCPEHHDVVWQNLVSVFAEVISDQHLYRSISEAVMNETGHRIMTHDSGLIPNWQQLLPMCWTNIQRLISRGCTPTRQVFRDLFDPVVADLVIGLANLFDTFASHQEYLESRCVTLRRYVMKTPRPPEATHKPHPHAKQLRLNLAYLT